MHCQYVNSSMVILAVVCTFGCGPAVCRPSYGAEHNPKLAPGVVVAPVFIVLNATAKRADFCCNCVILYRLSCFTTSVIAYDRPIGKIHVQPLGHDCPVCSGACALVHSSL